MGYNATIILTTSYAAPGKLLDLGFEEIDTDNEHAYILNGRKINVTETLKAMCMLPWIVTNPEQHHHILWADDYTSQDDGWGGRSAPYGWNHEVLVVPPKGRPYLKEQKS